MGSRSPTGRGSFEGEEVAHCKVWGILSMCSGNAAFCQITLTTFLSDVAIFVLKRDVKLQLTNIDHLLTLSLYGKSLYLQLAYTVSAVDELHVNRPDGIGSVC